MQEAEDDEVFHDDSSGAMSSLGPRYRRPRAVNHLQSVDSGYEPTSRPSHSFSDSDAFQFPAETSGRGRSCSVVERPTVRNPHVRFPLQNQASQRETTNQIEPRLRRRATWPQLTTGVACNPRWGTQPTPDVDVDIVGRRARCESMRSVGTQTSGSLESLLEGLSIEEDEDDSVFCSSSALGSSGPLPDVIQPESRWQPRSFPWSPSNGDNRSYEFLGRQLRGLADEFCELHRRPPRRRSRTWSLQETFRLTSHIEIRSRRWSVLGWGREEENNNNQVITSNNNQ